MDYSKLSKKQLLDEKAKIDFFLKNKRESSTSNVRLNLFYKELDTYLREKINFKCPPLKVLSLQTSRNIYDRLVEFNKMVDSWLDEVVTTEVTRSHRVKLYRLTFPLIGDVILERDRLLSLAAIVALGPEVFPGVIDRAFPGYIASGLILLILEAKNQRYDEEDML